MKLMIEMPEEDFTLIRSVNDSNLLLLAESRVMLAVKNGTPLPEHHGRLIDADTLDECKEMMNTIMGECEYAVRMDDIRNVPTIIPAAKEGE